MRLGAAAPASAVIGNSRRCDGIPVYVEGPAGLSTSPTSTSATTSASAPSPFVPLPLDSSEGADSLAASALSDESSALSERRESKGSGLQGEGNAVGRCRARVCCDPEFEALGWDSRVD